MANTYTYSGGSGSTAGSMTDIVQTAYNAYIRLQFKTQPIFDAVAQAQRVTGARAPRRGATDSVCDARGRDGGARRTRRQASGGSSMPIPVTPRARKGSRATRLTPGPETSPEA